MSDFFSVYLPDAPRFRSPVFGCRVAAVDWAAAISPDATPRALPPVSRSRGREGLRDLPRSLSGWADSLLLQVPSLFCELDSAPVCCSCANGRRVAALAPLRIASWRLAVLIAFASPKFDYAAVEASFFALASFVEGADRQEV